MDTETGNSYGVIFLLSLLIISNLSWSYGNQLNPIYVSEDFVKTKLSLSLYIQQFSACKI